MKLERQALHSRGFRGGRDPALQAIIIEYGNQYDYTVQWAESGRESGNA